MYHFDKIVSRETVYPNNKKYGFVYREIRLEESLISHLLI